MGIMSMLKGNYLIYNVVKKRFERDRNRESKRDGETERQRDRETERQRQRNSRGEIVPLTQTGKERGRYKEKGGKREFGDR